MERITSPAFDGLSPDAARAILRMKLKPVDVRRIHSLSSLAKKGGLSVQEKGELDLYLQIGHMLTLMHSKARSAIEAGGRRRKTA